MELAERVRLGELGTPYTSDYVFDEVVATALIRTGNPETAIKAGEIVLGSLVHSTRPLAKLVAVGEGAFNAAWAAFRTKKNRRLSFTDHTIVAQMKELSLDTLVSFDSGFDGVVRRVS